MTIRNYILKNNGTEDDIEDIVQDTCIVVWEKVCQSDFQLTSKLSTLVFSISKNLWLKKLNKNKRFSSLSDYHNENLSVLSDEISNQDKKIVIKYLEELGTICQSILTMFYFENKDMNEIAKAMNYNNSDTAKAKKHQCFKKLQENFLSHFNKSDFLGN